MPIGQLSEAVAKKLYYKYVSSPSEIHVINRSAINLSALNTNQKYVAKVDQNIKGRFKKNLVRLNATHDEIYDWITKLDPLYKNFIIEPMVDNIQTEYYLLIRNVGQIREIVFSDNGGINVDTHNSIKIELEYGQQLLTDQLPQQIRSMANQLYNFYTHYHLTFLEINPLAKTDLAIYL